LPSSPMLRFRLRKDFGRRINRLFGTHKVGMFSVTWENAALGIPVRGFVSRHLSMSLGFIRCRAPISAPKSRLYQLRSCAPTRGRLPYRCLDRLQVTRHPTTTTGTPRTVLGPAEPAGMATFCYGVQAATCSPVLARS
jgi:hypothetical protein